MKIIAKIPPALLYCVISLSTFTETIYSAALPQIAELLNSDGGTVQLASSSYFFGFAIGILTLGRVSDIYGRRPVMLIGLIIYIFISLSIGFCQNIYSFIILRFLQAYGASVGSVIAQSMARDSYKGWELSYVYANVAMVMAVVPTAGAYIGGNIVEHFSWQADFYFLTFFACILLLINFKFLPETNPNIGPGSAKRFFTVFKVIMSDTKVLSHALIVGSYNGICFGFYIQAPFIFIDRLEMPPSDYVTLFLLLTIANLLGGFMSRHMIGRHVNSSKITTLGFSLSIIGVFLMLAGAYIPGEHQDLTSETIKVFIPMMIQLIGHCLVVPILLRHALEDYSKINGTAGSIFGFTYYIITGAISFLIASFHSDYINNFAILSAVLVILSIGVFFARKENRLMSQRA